SNLNRLLLGGTYSDGFDSGSVSWAPPRITLPTVRVDLNLNKVVIEGCESSGSLTIQANAQSFAGLVVSNEPVQVSCPSLDGEVTLDVNIAGASGNIGSGSYEVSCSAQGCASGPESFNVNQL
ncbi:MAG: hypothetical protein R3208_11680, partial [Ketobacteraceae bacterium]|nr:hypothetical protein [Ketobacteraceae bacterium]